MTRKQHENARHLKTNSCFGRAFSRRFRVFRVQQLSLFGLGMIAVVSSAGAAQSPRRGTLLEDLTWQQAETTLKRSTVVVIPMGAESKEHGPHLRLSNDFVMAEYLKR